MEGRRLYDFPAFSPLIRDTFPKDDTSPPFDLSRQDRFWSNLQFLENPIHPNLLLQDPNDKMEDNAKNNRPVTSDNNNILANQNRSLLNFLKRLKSRLQKNRWRSVGMSEISIPQDVIGEYLLDLLSEPNDKDRSQSIKNNIITEEMILPLIWDESISNKKARKENNQHSYKRTFLSQSWKPGGLAEKQSMPLQREKNHQQSKSTTQKAYTMSILGLHGWRPGKKKESNKIRKFYHVNGEEDNSDEYLKSPEMSKEMVTLHITSRNSPRNHNNDARDINMQMISTNDAERFGRPLKEKLEGKMDDLGKKQWKSIMSRQRQDNV